MSGARIDFEGLSTRTDDQADHRIEQVAGTAQGDPVDCIADLLDELLGWKPGDNEPPPALSHDVTAAAVAPSWVESQGGFDRIRRGQRVFTQREQAVFVVLGLSGLPACYRQPQIAEMLATSGRLAIQVFRRLRETADFVAAVSQEGAFEPGGHGLEWCRKVRYTHAAMRYLIRHEPPVRAAPTGRDLQDFLLLQRVAAGDSQPLNQVELAFVLQTFGYLQVKGMRALRVSLSPKEAADHIFLWSFVGHHLGLEDELLPRLDGNPSAGLEQQSRDLFARIETWNHEHSPVPDSGRLLTATLLVTMSSAMLRAAPSLTTLRDGVPRGHPLRWIPSGLIRRIDRGLQVVVTTAPGSFVRLFLGRRAASELGVGRAPFLHYLGHQVAFALAGWFPPPPQDGEVAVPAPLAIATSSQPPPHDAGGRPSAPGPMSASSQALPENGDESPVVPIARAFTPAQFLRRRVALRFGEHVDRWRELPPPSFGG